MMLVLLLCVIMKIAELSVGRVSPTLSLPSTKHPPPCCNKLKRRYRIHGRFNNKNNDNNNNTNNNINKNNKYRYNSRKCTGKRASMMEDPQTPNSDCNSNPADPISQDLISSEFIQDNSDYQWFIDYGYRDGGLHVHPSVLSSLSTSYTQDDLGYYDDLARNLDANLAEVDMESFRTADIHNLLSALPVMCTDPVQQSEFNYQRERYASISGSVMEKIDIGSSISPHSSSQGEDSACSTTDTNSICKSSLLFSPVKETPVLPPGGSYSVDSLDCEDMLLTCQTNNKNNYTIAFEGSMTMYSDSSQDFETHEKQKPYENREIYYNRKIDMKNTLDYSMACSDSKIYTTWSNLKHSSTNNKTMTRHGSGNNNTISNFLQAPITTMLNTNKKSLSLPDLRKTSELEQIAIPLNFSMDSAESHHQNLQNSGLVMSRSVNDSANSNISTGKKIQNMSLVKLFMKQKSMSAEGMSLTLDQSDSASDNGWPTSNSGSDSGTANTNTQIQRHSINDPNKERTGENDFAINWVKADCYNKSTSGNSSHDSSSHNTSRRIPSIKEFKEESPSVEELSESLMKSDINFGKINPSYVASYINESAMKNVKKAWNDCKLSFRETAQSPMPPQSTILKTTGTQAMTQVDEIGVQTSLLYVLPPKNNFPCMRETFVDKKPVYVVYPNYTLPDLSFLNVKESKQIDNIALKPHERVWKKSGRSNSRPFSCNDIDALKQRGFSHVTDWESLTFLLPNEYRKILHDVPEVSKHIKLNDEINKPLFCLSPPIRHRQRTITEVLPTNVSSSSSTGTQPSSGYRGSSTILTDSSTNQQNFTNNKTTTTTTTTTMNPLYLYRYDSGSSENSLISHDRKLNRCVTKNNGNLSRNGGNMPKRSISLPHGEKDQSDFNSGKVPPRPPLPRSILRKNRSNSNGNKRYSMFEMGGVDKVEDRQHNYQQLSTETNKRMSLQEPYYINNDLQLLRYGRIIDSDKDVDEVEERRYAERMREVGNCGLNDVTDLESSGDDVKQLEEFFKRSGISSNSDDEIYEDTDVKLRSYVRRFLSLKMNRDIVKGVEMLESQKKTVSFAQVNKRQMYVDGKLGEAIDTKVSENIVNSDWKSINIDEKKKMMCALNKSVDLLIKYWNKMQNGTNRTQREYNDKIEYPQICLSNLCPALYAIMSDGLKPHLSSTFGPISNSVWQIVEASSQQGPLTNTLNELVQKINSEDFLTEGMLKFNAFVFGLLNLRALDAWFAYLCTRETILRKHYGNNSLFVGALSCANSREIIDNFLSTLQPLAFFPFQIDLLYQYRQLHNSFNHVNNLRVASNNEITKVYEQSNTHCFPSPKNIRPRSCGSYDDRYGELKSDSDMDGIKKRWSNIPAGSTNIYPALEQLTREDSEKYTDSLENSPLNCATTRKNLVSRISAPEVKTKMNGENDDEDNDDNHDDGRGVISGGLKFRKLQEKWELMVGKDEREPAPSLISPTSPNQVQTSVAKSKIPRLLTSPIKQSCAAISGKSTKSPVTGIPSLKKPTPNVNKLTQKKSVIDSKIKDVPRRTSRVDQESTVVTPRTHLTRPSSLPYKSLGVTAKEKNLISPQRRAASTSIPRANTPATSKTNTQIKRSIKEVRTLTHRLPADNGHLSFNEGDRLKVILEVDNKWLLCAKGDKKGLVPRSCVHPCQT